MSEYHKIETLYERDEHFKIGPDLVLRNRVYDTLKTWRWTEKVDGTNIRVIWQGGKLSFGGKTDNASIPADLVKWLYENITPEKLAACFPDRRRRRHLRRRVRRRHPAWRPLRADQEAHRLRRVRDRHRHRTHAHGWLVAERREYARRGRQARPGCSSLSG